MRRRGRAINPDASTTGGPSSPLVTERLSQDPGSLTHPTDTWGDPVQPFLAPESVLRLVSLNVSGLPANPSSLKYQDLQAFLYDYSVDILCLSELNLAWHCLPEESHFSHVTRQWFRSAASVVAWFRDRSLTSPFQHGGVGILVRDSHTGRICGRGEDPSGLGRWVWLRLRGHRGSHVRIFSAYRPVHNPRDPGSVWSQHWDFLLASDPPRDCNPRQAFLTDLSAALQTAYAAGDQILVALDANEPTLWQPGNVVDTAFSHTSLQDMHRSRHDDATTAPPTHNRGSRPIDAIYGSDTFAPFKSGYLPFGSAPGDHRPLWIDLPLLQLFGTPKKASQPSSARRLQCNDPRVVRRYQEVLRHQYHDNDVARRAFALESSVTGPLSSAQAQEWESLDNLRVQGIFQADYRCRRLRTGSVPWSPRLGAALALHRFWDRFYHYRIGRNVSFSYLRRLAQKAGQKIPDAMPTDEILHQRTLAWEAYRAIKKEAPAARSTFLASLAQAHADAGLESATTGLANMIRREKQRKDAALLRSIMKPGVRSGLASIDTPRPNTGTWTDGDWTGEWDTFTDRQGIETGCLQENDRRFRQASGTDLLIPSTVSALGPMGTSHVAVDLLDSGSVAQFRDFPISDATLVYLSSHKRPSVLVSSASFPLDLRTPAYAASWKKMDKYTASGPSGLHFGHFQANAMDPGLAAVDAALARIPVLSGYVPQRWMQGLNVMLEKKPGVSQVTKLRTILLYEADFNHNNKLMGRAMMHYAEDNQLLAPEQYGSRKFHSAIFQYVNKVLTFDILRQTRKPGALCLNDAKSCYDRIAHGAAGLAMQRCGVPPRLVEASLGPIQRLRHYIRTQYGDSTRFFCADNGTVPVHGIGQGNGAGPAIWAVVSTPIFNAMRQRGFGIFLRSPQSGDDFIFVGYAFVDDTDIVVNNPSPLASAATVTSKLQESINFWEGTLRVSGGALAPSKCHWYLIDYQWLGNSWSLVTPEQVPATVSVRSPSGRRVSIERVHPSEARKTLGVWSAPDGSMQAQLSYLWDKVHQWVEKVRVRHLPHHLVWLSMRTGIFKTLEYPLAATTFTPLQCRELCAPLLRVGLSRSHIVRSMPRDVVYGPSAYGGFNLPNLYVEQGLAHLRTFLQFGRSRRYITGFLLRSSVEFLQLEIGILDNPFHQDPAIWSASAAPTWCTSLWQFCSAHHIALPSITTPFPLLRSGDRPLMRAFWHAGYRSPKILKQLNACRLFLQALTLANITTTDGRHICPDAWRGRSPCGRRRWLEAWPRAPPSSALDWNIWRQALHTTFGIHLVYRSLTTTLGSWSLSIRDLSVPLYCPRDDRI